ncbi:DJ-1/PfpI family protein [Leptospira ryugenii]|uniref:DJ-1/PfpI family protein n=1 Tax=Leptospira ryugenii TaxID=1917863 RepID=A0A2P2E449_9LEPT|nr:type 1 glutamine amidotransferase domain-containing protein [Leptospira ryugenii]GBF51614.1 DJ-1/PfpI family protein [Leptospira ryugenii]
MNLKPKLISLFIISILSGGFFPVSAKPKILIVMSAASTLALDNNPSYPTGVFINELYEPIRTLDQKGYDLVFASPKGKPATMDPESLKDKYWESKEAKEEAIRFLQRNASFQNPEVLELVLPKSKSFQGLLIPGGQGLMSDLLYDPTLPKLLETFQKENKAIGLVCHAPALLTTLDQSGDAENFLFKGYRVNSVTSMEEWFIETFVMKGTPKVRKISSLLEKRGMVYESSFLPGRPYAVRDRNLVTSQNPFSGTRFTELYVEALDSLAQKP